MLLGEDYSLYCLGHDYISFSHYLFSSFSRRDTFAQTYTYLFLALFLPLFQTIEWKELQDPPSMVQLHGMEIFDAYDSICLRTICHQWECRSITGNLWHITVLSGHSALMNSEWFVQDPMAREKANFPLRWSSCTQEEIKDFANWCTSGFWTCSSLLDFDLK